MIVRIRKSVFDEIITHAQESYPEECCGLLVASSDNAAEMIETIRLRNSYSGPRSTRYSIDPIELYQADKSVSERGCSMAGIYHSHPEHEARPSSYDLEYAWPGLFYVIVSVFEGRFKEARCWVLDIDRRVNEQEILMITV